MELKMSYNFLWVIVIKQNNNKHSNLQEISINYAIMKKVLNKFSHHLVEKKVNPSKSQSIHQ